jgi:hypothetical protein
MQPVIFQVEIENGKYKINYDGGVSRDWDEKELKDFFKEWMKEHKISKKGKI